MSAVGILRGLLITIEVISAALLLILILMQRSKSQGMGLAFGSGMGESLFGAQMGNVLTKATVILAVVFLTTTTILAMLGSRGVAKNESLSSKISSEQSSDALPDQQMPPMQNAGMPPAGVQAEVPDQPLQPVEIPNTQAAPSPESAAPAAPMAESVPVPEVPNPAK